MLVNYLGELDFGAKQEQDPSWFIGEEQLKELWDGNRRVILVISDGHLEKILALLDPHISSVALKTEKRVVLVNRR